MTRTVAALVALLAVVGIGACEQTVAAAPMHAEDVQRVWVEQDGETVWEVECPASLTPRECLRQDLAADLMDAVGVDETPSTRTVTFDPSAPTTGEWTLHSNAGQGPQS